MRFPATIVFAAVLAITITAAGTAEKAAILTGAAAMGDWRSDAPGVIRKITVHDLPPPSSTALAINGPHVVARSGDAQPRVALGFKIELYASGFRDPRLLYELERYTMKNDCYRTRSSTDGIRRWGVTAYLVPDT